MLRTLFIILLLSVLPFETMRAASAIQEYDFESEQQEQRFRQLIFEMRCPMCLNSNLAGSDAAIAADLRQEIYSQIMDGRSNEEIIDFLQSRYGDFILYRPPLNTGTALLWFGPAVLLLAGFFIARRMMLSSNLNPTDGKLTAQENKKLKAILASRQEDTQS